MNPSSLINGVRVCAALVLLLASSACRSDAPQSAAPDAAPARGGDSAGLLARIAAERGAAACTMDAQCHSIGVGAKACGGPERYLAWSSKDNDGARLRALVAEHAAARRAEDRKAGMMSTCSMVLDPGAVCAAGQCVLGSAAPGTGGSQAR